METTIWKKLFLMDGPSARDKHGMVVLNSKAYIYGGNVSPENLQLEDMWCFDFENISWFAKQNEVVGAVIEKIEPKSQVTPGKLAGLRLMKMNDERHFLLFGGINDQKQTQNTLYIFDTERKEWKI